jgi:hypothetical protein
LVAVQQFRQLPYARPKTWKLKVRSIDDNFDVLIIQNDFPNTVKKSKKEIPYSRTPIPLRALCHRMQVIMDIPHLMQTNAVQSSYAPCSKPKHQTFVLAIYPSPTQKIRITPQDQELTISKSIFIVSVGSSLLDPSLDFLSSYSLVWGPSFPCQEASDSDSNILRRSWASTLHTQAHCTGSHQ